MPPKRIIRLVSTHGKFKNIMDPKVILHRLDADTSKKITHKYCDVPPTSNLFNKPELSDIKLRIGDSIFYAHKLILSAGSHVFARMFTSEWTESKEAEIELQEDEDCVEHFEKLLYFFYSGTIIIKESFVVSLYILADKYDVKPVYDRCVDIIENALKVYRVTKSNYMDESPAPSGSTEEGVRSADAQFNQATDFIMAGTDGCENSNQIEEFFPADGILDQAVPGSSSSKQTTQLIASETFTISTVIQLLNMCQNERITQAALYNMQARLTSQFHHQNFGRWNDLDESLVRMMLSDKYFFCSEFLLFSAAKSWISYKIERQTSLVSVMSLVRYGILDTKELYLVEQDALIKENEQLSLLVSQAIRYKLFSGCLENSDTKGEWSGSQFERRTIREL